MLNPDGRFEATNPAWERALGYSSEEIESREFGEFVHPEDLPRSRAAFEQLKLGKPILNFANRFRHANGSYRWLSWNCVPDEGRYYCNARDVTDFMDDQLALRSREEEARFREQFIAVLGHDLRNPVAALHSALSILGRENLSERAQTVIKQGYQSINRMDMLISDLMDFARSRLGSGISLDIRKGDGLGDAVRETVSEIGMVHPAVEIVTTVAIGHAVPCDIARIRQLLSNLLSNAIAHGDISRPIVVDAVTDAKGFRLSVSNRGNAITPAVQVHLFEPFVREESQPSQEGLGLGLYICSQIAKSHGGVLKVASDSDLTTFTFELPPRDD